MSLFHGDVFQWVTFILTIKILNFNYWLLSIVSLKPDDKQPLWAPKDIPVIIIIVIIIMNLAACQNYKCSITKHVKSDTKLGHIFT